METPHLCPVCGHDSIHAVTRTALVTTQDEELVGIAYQCGEGHVFLAAETEEREDQTEDKK